MPDAHASKKALILYTHEDVNDLLVAILKEEGFTTSSENVSKIISGEIDPIYLIAEKEPDLVLYCIGMRYKEEGEFFENEVVDKIRKSEVVHKPRFILMTSIKKDEIKETLSPSGEYTIVGMPFDYDEFTKAIRGETGIFGEGSYGRDLERGF